MRIVIDLQAAQTRSARRGIGRYSLALAQAMCRQASDHEILIALNGGFTDTIEPLRAAFAGILPDDAVRVWDNPLAHQERPSDGLRRVAAHLREGFIASLEPDVIHVSSAFESAGEGAVVTCGTFAAVPTAVTLYDLIPLLMADRYLGD